MPFHNRLFPAETRSRLQNRAKTLKLTSEAENENQRRNVRDEGAPAANTDASHVCGRRQNDGPEGGNRRAVLREGRVCVCVFLLISQQRKQRGGVSHITHH